MGDEQRFAGQVSVYGLPDRVGGWLVPPSGLDRIEICAVRGGQIVGRTVTHPEAEATTGHLTFELQFDAPQDPGLLAGGHLTIQPRVDGRLLEPLPCWDVLEGVDAVAEAMATITAWKGRLGGDFESIVSRLPSFFPARIEKLFAGSARPTLTGINPSEPAAVAANGASAVDLPVGVLSRSGDAVLGQDGYVFLLQGSNRIIDQYRLAPDAPEVTGDRDRWLGLFARRRREALRRGVAYAQMIIPEKHSVLPEKLPRDLAITTPTPLLAGLERAVRDDPDLRPHYLAALDGLTQAGIADRVYGRVDTHLMPFGAERLVRALLRHLGETAPDPDLVFDTPSTRIADLGDRFFDVRLLDTVLDTATPPYDRLRASKVEEVIPDHNAHQGRRQVWRNPQAPIAKTLVVFGNSFCNFADQGQFYLSFWLAQLYQNYQFVWSPAIDWAYVDAVRPDIVLGQTIERFLTMVPEA